MSKFIVEDDFWEVFPEAKFAVILAKGIDNKQGENAEIQQILAQANQDATKFFGAEVFSENPAVAIWRDAYRKFKTKKGSRSSIENLLKRVDKGNEVGSINPLVDIYNAVSLTYALPVGGEDLDTFIGDMRLTHADGGEDFTPIGDDEPDNALPGEVVYKDEVGAVCRGWNWRDGQRTMLTNDSTNVFLIIESVDQTQSVAVDGAAAMLQELLNKYFETDVAVNIVDREHPAVEL